MKIVPAVNRSCLPAFKRRGGGLKDAISLTISYPSGVQHGEGKGPRGRRKGFKEEGGRIRGFIEQILSFFAIYNLLKNK